MKGAKILVDTELCAVVRNAADGQWDVVHLNGCYGSQLEIIQADGHTAPLSFCGLKVFGSTDKVDCSNA